MSEEEPRTSRFRRGSRFRTPKAPPPVGGEAAPPATAEGAASAAPSAPPAPSVAKPPAPPAATLRFGVPAVEEAAAEKAPPPTPLPAVEPAVQFTNALAINVHEWFQTAASSEVIRFSHWSRFERRIERGVHMILALLRKYNVKATFFILGIVAREFPEMVKLIAGEGHEIGAAGYYNRLLHSIPPKEYMHELEMSLTLLKKLTNQDVVVHRAPELSLTVHTLWVMEILNSFGIKYDSSICPINSPLCGISESPRFPYTINPYGIIEFPPSTYQFLGTNVNIFGGTYFRVLPYGIISMGINDVNRKGFPAVVSITPWEIDAEFPKLKLSWDGYMSQYAGIKSSFARLSKLLNEFRFDTITRALEEYPPKDSFHISTLGKRR